MSKQLYGNDEYDLLTEADIVVKQVSSYLKSRVTAKEPHSDQDVSICIWQYILFMSTQITYQCHVLVSC